MSGVQDRIVRIVAPRWSALVGPGATYQLACNATTTVQELDNGIFQQAPPAGGVGQPGSVGRALMYFQNDDASNTIFINFGPNNSVVANSAQVGANAPWAIYPRTISLFEIDPFVDKFFQATTPNGTANTAVLRYRIGSFPTQGLPASG